MKRLAAVLAVLLLALWPVPAHASNGCQTVNAVGIVCMTVANGVATTTIQDPITGATLATISEPVPVPAPVTVTVPGPTATVTLPGRTVTVTTPGGTSTVTQPGRTVTLPGQTVTQSGGTVTQTQVSTVTEQGQTIATGQDHGRSATVHTTPPTLATPPDQANQPVHLLPRTPAGVAAESGIIGIIVGILLGLAAMYYVYKRGRKEGEKATLQEFLGVIKGIHPDDEVPTVGRHRAIE